VNASTAQDKPEVAAEGLSPDELRHEVRRLISTEGYSQAQIARESANSPTALSQWLDDKYAGNSRNVEAKLQKWLDAKVEREEFAGTRPTGPGYFITPSSKRIMDCLAHAQFAGDMVEIIGVPGSSKTTSARRYQERNPNVWLSTMAPHAAGVVPALEEVAEALGLRDVGGGARGLSRAIRRRINGSGGLLIVDEAQHLSLQSLEEIRSIHDANGMGLALMGSEHLHGRLTGGTRAPQLAQLFSRIGMKVHLRKVMRGDVEALCSAWGIADKEARGYVEQVALKPGALRQATKVVRLAAARAKATNAPVTVDLLQAAWSLLGDAA